MVVVVAFIAAAMIAPISTAGTVNMVLDPNDNSANLTIKQQSRTGITATFPIVLR